MAWFALSRDSRVVVLHSTLAGLVAGVAAGLLSWLLGRGPLGPYLGVIYVAGLAYTIAAIRGLGVSRALEGAVAYTALYLGLLVGVYNALPPHT